MSVQIIKKQDQAKGAFDFGRILENKPLGFPHEGGATKPLSNLFYWAHAWSDTGGLIGEHPHQGFEIMSYVIDGVISHYDNKMAAWKNLTKGDAQLIKSGNGITHAEKILPGAHIFQIWFDPNLSKSLKIPASYTDVASDLFPMVNENGMTKKIIVGENSPLNLDSEGVEIYEYRFEPGSYGIPASKDSVYGVYVISGELKLGGHSALSDDYLVSKDSDQIALEAKKDAVIFIVKINKEVSYHTYAQSQGIA